MIPNWLKYNKSVFPRKPNVHMTVKANRHHRKSVVMVTSRHPIIRVVNTLKQCLMTRNVQFVTRRYCHVTEVLIVVLVWLLAVTGDCIGCPEGEGRVT